MTKSIHNPRRETAGGFGNQILYRMCREHPGHKKREIISGKLWIIGRAYSAAIERRKGKPIKKDENFTRDHAAPKIEASKIDIWISDCSKLPKLTEENLEKSLACHKKVTNLFKKISGMEKRSLASKYLHFHAPHAFFIYDSIANKRIKELIQKGKLDKSALHKLFTKFGAKQYDPEYARFCVRCLCYLKSKKGSQKTPRQLDMELLKYPF